jgi:hypothetical protein
MKNQSDWLNNTERQIDQLKGALSDKDYKKYKLHQLLCLAERVAQFYPVCVECQIFQQDLSALIQDIGNLIELPDKNRHKSYLNGINKITRHLQKQHKLVDEGYYMGIGMAIGSGVGVALGVALEQIGGGIPIGIGTGLAIGAALDAKAKREGRILCPKESKATSSVNFKYVNFKIVAVILGILVLAGLAVFFFFQQSN